MTPPSELWAKVVKRKGKRKTSMEKGEKPPTPNKLPTIGAKAPPTTGAKRTTAGTAGQTTPKPKKLTAPTTAAVTITCPKGIYAQVMAEAKSKISLPALGILELRAKRPITGALVYEILESEGRKQAARLHSKLEKVFSGSEGVKVARSYRRAPTNCELKLLT
jgi:hypothetical protein